ncbi:SUMF1/EgtB/PvdO family nonheme iron enzyme [Pseudanabaena sp. FACHB-1277]|uniref:SUMF1/EgtB/PvdO family nonheme iron enzyme n=1 Tax=Pseudanabaena cinerea FACHB-1277 TaxID=2949581 RepID=A0A926Z5L8_9CYAN|nr:SUMF1/EgtB/PvdO family nonheme iron enzyme [Pseudanabaena cinerea]MBD2149737.1 SUMF1/EgtB/PvdO family nonheme iron enzyme [Pseudanabaena cinerea FACHB-1277]
MKNIAIAIGINQYRNLQHLQYAKNDAQLFSDFLLRDAGFDRVWYFADDSPDIEGVSTEPIRSNLLTVLNDLSENAPSLEIDNLWFFFAGHGIQHKANDYLLMADSNPNLPEETAIATNLILQNLKQSKAKNVILFLDACRNVGRRDGRGIGDRTTADVKKISDTVCFFACSPHEFSYELPQYNQGIFTYALLEGLGIQHKRATVEKLEHFLKLRVSQLAEIAKAKQNPRVVNDSGDKHLILMPKYADKSDLLPLKNAAVKAHRDNKLDLARYLWMQILSIDGTDYEAILEIEGLAVERYKASLPITQDRVVEVASSPEMSMRQVNATTVENRQKLTDTNPLILDLGDGVTLELVKVPAGKFMMGSPDGKGDDDERPQHQVILQEFFIGKYAVTNAQWQAVMKKQGSANCDKEFQGDLQPVVGVSWHEARAFCAKVQQQTGKAVRLPTEAEWEYAARGANQSKGYEYAGSNNLEEVGWYRDNSGNVTHPVGQKKANELGIYDMSGNVWEWCLDELHDSYADKPENLKKQGNQAWGDLNVDNNDNRSRSRRGGSWIDFAILCRSAYRGSGLARDQINGISFRVVFASSS